MEVKKKKKKLVVVWPAILVFLENLNFLVNKNPQSSPTKKNKKAS